MWLFQKPDKNMFLNWRGYPIGAALVALFTWIKYLAQPDIIAGANSLPYILVVVAVAIFWGLGPSIFVSLISTLAYLYFFRSPVFSFVTPGTPDIIVLFSFLVTAVIISFLASNLRHKNDEALKEVAARKKSEAELVKYRDHLEDLVKQRTAELEQANTDLRDREEHLKQVQEIAHLGSWELDLKTNKLTWSDEAYRIFGVDPREFGAAYEDFLNAVHPEDRSTVDRAYSFSLKTRSNCYEMDHRIVRKNTGETRYVHEKCTHYRDANGNVIRSVGMVQDITERKQMEQSLAKANEELETRVKERTAQLAESEEKYRKLVENANEVITILQDRAIKFFGGKTLELTGYTYQDLAARPFPEVIHPDDRKRAIETYEKIVRDAAVPPTHEFRILCKEGETRWVQINAAKITWENQPAVLAMLTDITERKMMEQELKDYAQKITRVQEEERKRIAYELHDDTAQYLSILKMELDSLIQSGQIRDPKILAKLQFLEKDASRAFDDVRRYSHELRPGVLEHLGLQAALEQMADDINKLKQLPVEVKVDGREPQVSEDIKLGFFRIAQEALNNARKHSAATRVLVRLKYSDHLIQMTVQDNGTGFDMQKVKARNQASVRGSMGLTSMQERARLIGADLKIESEPGQGTKVIVKSRV